MHPARLAALGSLFLTLGLPAQTDIVLPAAFATRMGSTANRIPHARHLTKYQQVFLGSEINGGGGFVIKSLSLREDEVYVGAAGTYSYTVRLGPTARDHTSLTADFAGNFSGPATTVFSGAFNLPASGGAGGVGSWLFTLPFSAQYVHQPGDNLLLEWINASAASSSNFLDFCYNEPGCTTGQALAFDPNATAATGVFADRGLVFRFSGQRCGTFVNYGAGLVGSGGFVPMISGSGCATLDQVISVQVERALGGAPACLFFGITPANQPVLGATLLVNPLYCLTYTLGGAGEGNGSKTFAFYVPDRLNYVGQDFFFQSIHADVGAAQGVSFTDGLKLTPDQ